MRLRISSVIFAFSIFLAFIILLYQILSLPTENHASPGKKPENIVYLESRIRRLEDDIVANQDTIKEIKTLVQSLSNAKDVKNLLLDIPDHDFPKAVASNFDREFMKSQSTISMYQPAFNFSKAMVQVDDCIFSQSSPSSVDIQMKDVYDLLPFDNPDGGPWKQGWRVEYDASQWSTENKLKVFVVPHSHNDPGWIKTFEKYFEDQTRHILDNMVVKLSQDHRRKFIWAEISFFSLWWDRQSMEVKDAVKRLVDRGQLEIVTGGWVMPDEANSHYSSMLDQLLTGHEWLQLNLGAKPNNGWAIDPFGLSPTMAYLLKRAGLQNMLIQRTHYSIKKYMARKKTLEFRWRQIWDTQASTDILCHMMPFYSYDVPHTCGPDPKICCQFDFRRLSGSGVTCPWRISPQIIHSQNVDARSRLILDQYRKKAQLYKTNVLLVPLGDDFRYDTPAEWDNQFNNYQKLFDYMNSQEELHVQAQFGTLADYFRALREEAEKSGKSDENAENFFPSLSGDFFSYSDRDKHYWTGYFTSRPFYKRMDRILQSYLRSAEILFSLMLETETHSGWTRNQQEVVYALMDNLAETRKHHGLFQHHDGITGTAKNHVVVDYANKLLSGIRMSQHVIQQAVNSLLSQKPTGDEEASNAYFELGEQFAAYNTIPEKVIRKVSMQSPFTIYVFNPDAHKRQQLISVRVDTPFIEVKDRSGEVLICQVDPVFTNDGEVILNQYDIYFLGSFDALSITGYTLEAVPPKKIQPKYTVFSAIEYRHIPKLNVAEVFTAVSNTKEESIYLQLGHVSANFSSLGLLQHITSNGQSMDVSLSFIKYDGGAGGAYLFLPRGTAQEMKLINCPLVVVRGPLKSHLTLHHYILKHQVILNNSPGVDGLALHINNYVDIKKERNTELAMRLFSSIKNDNIFYTDLNGFQIIKRARYDKLPLQANLYPMPTQMFIEDQKMRLTLLTGQPLGCTSLHQGEMEVIQDRQLTQDDERGLGHGVHDNVLTLNAFVLLLENKIESKEWTVKGETPSGYPSLTAHASLSYLLYPPIIMHPVTKDKTYPKHWNTGGELPCDVEMITLRSLTASRQPGAPHPPSSTIALTLHRLGFSCSFAAVGLSCSTNNGKLRLSDLFPASFSDEVKQMSLSHLYEGVDMSKSYSLSLHPMELYSYKLSISSVNK